MLTFATIVLVFYAAYLILFQGHENKVELIVLVAFVGIMIWFNMVPRHSTIRDMVLLFLIIVYIGIFIGFIRRPIRYSPPGPTTALFHLLDIQSQQHQVNEKSIGILLTFLLPPVGIVYVVSKSIRYWSRREDTTWQEPQRQK